MTEREKRERAKAARERAARLKGDFIDRIARGVPAQDLLSMAVECIGLYSLDPAYIKTGKATVASIYGPDLAQQTIFSDETVEQLKNLDARQADTLRKLRNYAETRARDLQSMINALSEVSETISNVEQRRIEAAAAAGISRSEAD